MELLGPVFSIILIDLVLSGDNAVVIGMAAHRLPKPQRRWAIIIGAGGAVVLRVILTAVAAILLGVPFLKLIGGVLLLWIAFRLLEEEEEEQEGKAAPDTLRAAILTILAADVIMSLDNVLGVAAAAHGSTELLIFGLALSMPIIMFGGSLISAVLDRAWWLAYLGSAVIAWTSVELILTDPMVAPTFVSLGLDAEHAGPTGHPVYDPTMLGYALMAAVVVVTLAAAHYVHRYVPARARG